MKLRNCFLILMTLILTSFFVGCKSNDLAKRCAEKYPCIPTKEVIDSIVYKTDTIRSWTVLTDIPLLKIRCFEYVAKDSIEVFKIPCSCISEKETIYRTQYVLDTANVVFLGSEIVRLRKDSFNLSVKISSDTSKHDFYRISFFGLLGLVLLVVGFIGWRITRK